MGLFDKFKDTAGKAKDIADEQVEKHGDKIPDNVEAIYDKVSDAAEKIIPGEGDGDAEAPAEA